MASEQLSRRENTTHERDIRIEKDRVPKMTTHFEHLAEHVKDSDLATSGDKHDTPLGSIDALQGGQMNKDHAGKAIGDVGGTGKARETHELGAHFESLADKVKDERGERVGGDQRASIVRDKESEAATRGRGVGGVGNVGKFEMQGGGVERGPVGREQLDGRTREIRDRAHNKSDIGEKERRSESLGQVVAEKGRGREEGAKVMKGVEREGAKARNEQDKFKGRVSGGGEKGGATNAVITLTVEGGDGDIGMEGGKQRKEASEARAKKNTDEVLSDYQNRYQGAKQSASEALGSTRQSAQEKASQSQAKVAALEKGQQGYGTTKDTLSSSAKTAPEYTAPVAEKASQAKDAALEKGQQGYGTAKDTLSSSVKTAAEYTAPVAEKAKDYTFQAAEKAKSAGGTTVQYVGEKAVQAKDVTLETGKTAADYAGKAAAGLKDKAAAAAWKAAHFSTEVTVEGTKAAANMVEGAAGYAGHKAAELAAMSVGAVKGLAASAGDTAKGYTARKKEEAERELQAKKVAQQEAEERPSQGIGETIGQYAENVLPSGQAQGQEGTGSKVLSAIGETVGNVGEKIKKPFENITGKQSGESYQTSGAGQQVQEKGSEVMARAGETLGDVAQRVKQPLDNITGNITVGGTQVLGAVGETVGEIGQTMIKPAERVQEHGEVVQGGGVLGAIGETIAEIAETTKAMVVGEGESETRKNVGSESLSSTYRGKH